MQDQFETDCAIWKREHESASNLKQVERENAIRQECRLERDRQIDTIVAKVDAEAMQNQAAFDLKLRYVVSYTDVTYLNCVPYIICSQSRP